MIGSFEPWLKLVDECDFFRHSERHYNIRFECSRSEFPSQTFWTRASQRPTKTEPALQARLGRRRASVAARDSWYELGVGIREVPARSYGVDIKARDECRKFRKEQNEYTILWYSMTSAFAGGVMED